MHLTHTHTNSHLQSQTHKLKRDARLRELPGKSADNVKHNTHTHAGTHKCTHRDTDTVKYVLTDNESH